jgi:hypothetical protein
VLRIAAMKIKKYDIQEYQGGGFEECCRLVREALNFSIEAPTYRKNMLPPSSM